MMNVSQRHTAGKAIRAERIPSRRGGLGAGYFADIERLGLADQSLVSSRSATLGSRHLQPVTTHPNSARAVEDYYYYYYISNNLILRIKIVNYEFSSPPSALDMYIL